MKKIFLIIVIISVLSLIAHLKVLTIYQTNSNKNMADPVWGLLPKSQTDAETIEEAIAQLIAEHETDSGAHTGSGESLETHKAQDIIDHKAGSVLADKDTMTEFVIKDDFRNLDGWGVTGDVVTTEWPGIRLYTEWGAVNETVLSTVTSFPAQFFDSDFDMLFQLSARYDHSFQLYESYFGLAIDSITPVTGIGFTIVDGVTKGVMALANVRVWTDPITNDETKDHIYRAQYDALTGKAYFYIDGVLKATIDKPAGSDSIDAGAIIGIELTQENDGNIFVGKTIFARGI